MPGQHLAQERPLGAATLLGKPAAPGKAATSRDVARAWRVALQADAVGSAAGTRSSHGTAYQRATV